MDQDQFKRMMLFGGVSFAIIIAWQFLFPAPRQTPQPALAAAAVSSAPALSPTGSAAASNSPPATSTPAASALAVANAPSLAASSPESFTLSSGKSTVIIRNRGALVERWAIDGSVENSKIPVELVHPYALIAGHALPLSLAGEPAADAKALNEALWQCAAAANHLGQPELVILAFTQVLTIEFT